jgi:glycosyltransferase involved in cell wall biosynthesis
MLTVAMIIKNEEQFIEKVIGNVQPVADEIVITDTGSTDRTVDIIKKFNVKLFHYSWNGDEARARNFTLSKCKTDWILFIDADEFIDIRDYQKIRKLMSGENGYIAYRIFRRHYIDPAIEFKNLYQKDWKGSYILHSIIRIFKNGEGIFFSRPIYVSVKDSLRDRIDKIGNSNVVFHHLDILRRRQKKIEKMKWYYHDVFENFRKYPGNPDVIYSLAHYYDLRSEFDKAIKYYKKALTLNPEHIKAKLSLGLTQIMLGKEEGGMRIIKLCKAQKDVYP